MSDFYLDPSVNNIFPNGATVTPCIVATRAPTAQDNQYFPSTLWFNTAAFTLYAQLGFSAGVPQWELIATATGDVSSLTGDTGTATPTAGNIKIAGTAAQITTTASGSTVTLSLSGPYTPATYPAHSVLLGEGASSIGHVGPTATAGQVLQSAGSVLDPAFSTATYPATATGTGTILRADGTNWSATTATYPNTTTANDILYSSATNVVGQITTANNAVLSTNGSGVPAMNVATSFTPAFSLATAGDSAWTYSSQVGRYQVVGALVFFTATLTWSNFTNSTGSGAWRVNLPVAAGAFVNAGQAAISGTGIDAGAETANLPANFLGVIGTGATVMPLSVQEGGVGNAASALFGLTVTQVLTAGTLNITGSYFAA